MWLRIVFLLAGVLLVGAAASYHLTSAVVAEREAFIEQARKWALERTAITEIEEITEYRGRQSYTVVIGKNRVGTPVIAWMTPDQVVYDVLEGSVSKESVREAVLKNQPDAEIRHIVPGIDGDKRFWEVLFIDGEQRYNYVYYDFYSGELLKAYRLKLL
ncbi:MAG: DUF5590 domain-containing protein [Brevibacillus sp.]|nr:DUF5590 domain-containing protein [Brevibacillus sp.]